MNRRHPKSLAHALLALAAVSAVSSCTTTNSTSEVVARVEDNTLTFDELEAQGDPGRPEFANGDDVRKEATAWVQSQLAAQSGVDKLYETAIADLGIMCVDVIQSREPNEDSLKDLVDHIDADGWNSAVEEWTGLSGSQPCQPTQDVAPVYLDPLTAAKPGEIVQIADPEGGYGVLRPRPYDELDQNDFLTVVSQVKPEVLTQLTDAIAKADVYINPRVGTYSPATLAVEPLGPPVVAAPAG